MNPIYESMETEGKQIISMSVKSVSKGTTATIYLFVYTLDLSEEEVVLQFSRHSGSWESG
jgi:hypothetical protein